MRPLLLCAVVLSGVLLTAVGCRTRSAPVHYLDRVEVSVGNGDEESLLALKPDELRSLALERLRPPSFVVLKPAQAVPEGARVYRAKLELAFLRESAYPDREGRWAEVAATLSLRRLASDDGEHYLVSALAEERVEGHDLEGRQLALRKALSASLDKLASNARAQLDALTKTDSVLVEELQSKDEPVAYYALQTLAERKHPAAVPLLLEQLGSQDLFEVRAAMGSLVELRETKAVPRLIELSRGRDSSFERELLFAISAIGGDEAQAYLYTVAQGHDDPSVSAAAREAFSELQSRSRMKSRAPSEAKRP